MTDFTISTFNVKNLIGAEKEYYRFEKYTVEEHAWKQDWLADHLLSLDADVVCFQEVFERDALVDVIRETNKRAEALNSDVIPDPKKRYARKAIFRKLGVTPYPLADVRWVANVNDGAPGQRRPGLAIASRLGFVGEVEAIQDLDTPLEIAFPELGSSELAGVFTLKRLSRPILKARIPIGDQVVTVFNIHFKSKLGEYIRPEGADVAPEADLTNYDAYGRALGELRAATRRMGEAMVLRGLILDELKAGNPVMAMGDFNDSEHAVSSAIVAGENPFKNYAWMRRHDAQTPRERYSNEESEQITREIEAAKMTSAEKLFIRKSLRDMIFTSAFGGIFESIDQILLSRHFHPDNPDRIGTLDYLSAFNDHLTDGSHPEAPYNKLASDHGQLVAHIKMRGGEKR
jgi:endonuclease/exonuclease/phosphatase family metal-dependent hydrolase